MNSLNFMSACYDSYFLSYEYLSQEKLKQKELEQKVIERFIIKFDEINHKFEISNQQIHQNTNQINQLSAENQDQLEVFDQNFETLSDNNFMNLKLLTNLMEYYTPTITAAHESLKEITDLRNSFQKFIEHLLDYAGETSNIDQHN